MIDVTCALIIRDRKVLIAQNGPESDHAFQWEFPGGKVKTGESAHSCIIREIEEELGIAIEVKEEMLSVTHDYGNKQIRLLPFICTILSGFVQLNEHIAISWVNFGELQKMDLSEADRRLILEPKNQLILKKYIGE